MCGLFQPICQVRYTNVATVRLKKNGERFEIACYKNKVVNWRSGIETDIQEVLQSPYIFTSISKGKLANNVQLMKAFNTTDINVIVKQILDKGEFQVSKEERNQILESTFRDIVSLLHELTINPNTGHPLTRTLLENSLKSIGFSVSINEPTKKQALRALTLLQKHYPENISRSKMRLRANFLNHQHDQITKFFNEKNATVESTTHSTDFNGSQEHSQSSQEEREYSQSQDSQNKVTSVLFTCSPNLYKDFENFILNTLDPPGTIQLIALNVSHSSLSPTSFNSSQETENLLDESQDDQEPNGNDANQPPKPQPREELPNQEKSSKMKCINCCMEFDDLADHRKHFKSDFHVFNSKRRLKGLDPITLEEFTHISNQI